MCETAAGGAADDLSAKRLAALAAETERLRADTDRIKAELKDRIRVRRAAEAHELK